MKKSSMSKEMPIWDTKGECNDVGVRNRWTNYGKRPKISGHIPWCKCYSSSHCNSCMGYCCRHNWRSLYHRLPWGTLANVRQQPKEIFGLSSFSATSYQEISMRTTKIVPCQALALRYHCYGSACARCLRPFNPSMSHLWAYAFQPEVSRHKITQTFIVLTIGYYIWMCRR